MPITRVSTFAVFQRAIDNMAESQSKIARTSNQISSGREAGEFTEMGKKVNRVQELESQLQRTSGYLDNNQIISNRLTVMQSSMTNIEQIIGELRNNLVLRRSVAGSSVPITQLAEGYLSQIEDALNVTAEGRYLFGGGRTDSPAVADLVLTNNIGNNGQPTPLYYRGDGLQVSARISDQQTLNYGVKADHSAFQKAIGALHLAIDGHESDSDAILADAVDMVNEALDEIVSLKNTVSNNVLIVENTNSIHESFEAFLGRSLGEQAGVDIAEATIRLSLDETVLQATLQNFARISSLKLVDFLR